MSSTSHFRGRFSETIELIIDPGENEAAEAEQPSTPTSVVRLNDDAEAFQIQS